MGLFQVRSALRDMLVTHLPERLDVLRADLGVEYVPDPDPTHGYRLLDSIPEDDVNPRVLVGSGSSEAVRSDGATADAIVTRRYDLIIGVTAHEARSPVSLTGEQASITRDLIVQGITECLRLHRNLGDGISIVVNASGQTDAGPGESQDQIRRKTSIGEISVVIDADEQINLNIPEVTSMTVTVQPMPAP